MKLIVTGLEPADADRLASMLNGTPRPDALVVEQDFPDVSRLAGDGFLLVCGYTSPGAALARAALDGTTLGDALARWRRRAGRVLAGLDQAPDRLVLIDVLAAAATAPVLTAKLGRVFGETVKHLKLGPAPSPAFEALLTPAAESWALEDREAARLLTALDAAAMSDAGARAQAQHRSLETDLAALRQALSAPPSPTHADNRVQALAAALDLCRADLAHASAKTQTLTDAAAPPAPGGHLLHNLVAGWVDRLRRDADLELVRGCGLFDPDWYQARYPDVRQMDDPALHYLIHGGREGRPAGPGFSSRAYFDLNPDLRGRAINPLVHYLRRGRAEGRPAATADGRLIKPEGAQV